MFFEKVKIQNSFQYSIISPQFFKKMAIYRGLDTIKLCIILRFTEKSSYFAFKIKMHLILL